MIECELIDVDSPSHSVWDEWRQLMTRATGQQGLFGPEWIRVWSQTWGAVGKWTGQLSLITARDTSGLLLGVLPLGKARIGPLAVFATGGHDVPRRGITSAEWMESEVGDAIGRFIANQQWPLIQLGPLRQASITDHAMISGLRSRSTMLHPVAYYDEITLHAPETWNEYVENVLSKKLIRKVRGATQRLNQDGELEIRHYCRPSEAAVRQMFDDLATVERASWMSTRESVVPRFSNPQLCHFWKELTLQYLSPKDHLDCWIMYFNQQPVSFCFTLTDQANRYVIANNYDQNVAQYSTGSVLYWHMIRDGIERGAHRFEFADGHLHYKQRWGARVDGCRQTFAAVPNRIFGGAASLTQRITSMVSPLLPASRHRPSHDVDDFIAMATRSGVEQDPRETVPV